MLKDFVAFTILDMFEATNAEAKKKKEKKKR